MERNEAFPPSSLETNTIGCQTSSILLENNPFLYVIFLFDAAKSILKHSWEMFLSCFRSFESVGKPELERDER